MIFVYISKHVYIKSIIYAKELFAYYTQSIWGRYEKYSTITCWTTCWTTLVWPLQHFEPKPFTSQSTWVDERVIILASLDPVEPLIWLELKITITNKFKLSRGSGSMRKSDRPSSWPSPRTSCGAHERLVELRLDAASRTLLWTLHGPPEPSPGSSTDLLPCELCDWRTVFEELSMPTKLLQAACRISLSLADLLPAHRLEWELSADPWLLWQSLPT